MINCSQILENARVIVAPKTYLYEFSICTLVTKKEEYAEMIASFVNYGFTYETCEYLYVDNSQGYQYDAFKGLNLFLQQAQGKYVILCHQDILLHDNNKADLKRCIEEMDRIDPKWGVLANAGGINLRWSVAHITEKSGKRHKETLLPLKVVSVDENFMLVKNDANLALSSNLSGFHMYGTDICLIADVLGYSAYVIDFNLIHKSTGSADASFFALRKELMQKYQTAFRGRFMSTTITAFYISGNYLGNLFCNLKTVMSFVRQYCKFFRKKNKYHVK